MEAAARKLAAIGPRWVLVKGAKRREATPLWWLDGEIWVAAMIQTDDFFEFSRLVWQISGWSTAMMKTEWLNS